MNKLHRFAEDGRYLGWIAQDRPIEEYAHRTDLTPEAPPDAPDGYEPVRQGDTWVLQQAASEEPSLAQLKTYKWAEMKTARAAAICAPLATPFGVFDADDEARNNIIHTAQLMQTEAQTLAPGEAPTVQFTLANNTVVALTAGQMVQVAMLLASQIQTAYANGRVVRSMIEAATTAEEVAAITW